MIPCDYIVGARPHRTEDPWWLAGSCGKKEPVMSGLQIEPWFCKLDPMWVCGAEENDAVSNSHPSED